MQIGGPSSYTPSYLPQPGGSIDFFTFLQNILTEDLTPVLHIVTLISYTIGLFLVIAGLSRLYRHGHGSHHQRVSPMGTAMYFVVGVVLISFIPYLQMLSNAFVQLTTQSALMTQCMGPDVTESGFNTASNNFCPMMAYSSDIASAIGDSDAVGEAIQYAVFAFMFLIGVIAFVRGMLLLIKIGEGGQGGHVGKAFSFICAGIVGVNMASFYDLFNNILTSNTAT